MTNLSKEEMSVVCANVVAASPESIIFSDREGIIKIWNHGSEVIFGFSAEDAIGQSLDIIIPEPFRKAHWHGYHLAINNGTTRHKGGSMMTRAVRKDEQQIYIDVSFAIVKNAAGEVIGSSAIARDATEKFAKEREMRKQLAELTAKKAE